MLDELKDGKRCLRNGQKIRGMRMQDILEERTEKQEENGENAREKENRQEEGKKSNLKRGHHKGKRRSKKRRGEMMKKYQKIRQIEGMLEGEWKERRIRERTPKKGYVCYSGMVGRDEEGEHCIRKVEDKRT
jgi:hypothetical protein